METKVEWTMCRVRATWSTCLDGILRSRPPARWQEIEEIDQSLQFYQIRQFRRGSGFEKSISWWCRTLDSFVVFLRFGLIWIARASVESFPTVPPSPPPLSLSACSTWLFLFVSFQEKKNSWDGERQIYPGEKERKRDEDEREQKQKENRMWQ